MPNCSVCGTARNALHSNGEMGISDVCSDCFPFLADAAAPAVTNKRAAKVKAYLSARDTTPLAAAPAAGGS